MSGELVSDCGLRFDDEDALSLHEQHCHVCSIYEDDDREYPCHTCGGDGWVLSVAEASGRHGWDTEGVGDCPNCGGSGNRSDCTVF